MIKPVILCVDDEKLVLDSLWDQISSVLGDEFLCELCESGSEALDLIDDMIAEGRQIAVVVSDQLMPDMRGDKFLISVHEKLPQTRKIMLTGQASFEAVQNAINKARLYRYIPKPWEEDDLLLTVTEAAQSFKQHLQLIEYNRILKTLNKATQELSGEIEVKKLFSRLMENVLENTGGDKCFLILDKNRNGMEIEAFAIRIKGIPVGKYGFESNEITDQIIPQITHLLVTRSISPHQLLVPIKVLEENIGYIFVGNDDIDNSFSQNHLEVIQMLASQAAISLKNANLISRIEERTHELETEKVKVEVKNQEIALRASEILKQKHELEAIHNVVEQKNRDIMDSIHYAQRIQYSVMPNPASLMSIFPESFIIYQPKDIVSGDFYWWHTNGNVLVLAVCDCTGHGVPGAFMSLMGVNFLNQAVNESKIYSPDKILDYLHTQFRNTLSKSADHMSKEGMDCSILVFDNSKKNVLFAGARRPLLLFRNKELSIIDGSKFSVGEFSEGKNIQYELHNLNIQSHDSFYLYSDGITDQFGGENYRKFTPKRLRSLLTEVQELPMSEQEQVIKQKVSEWIGKNDQTDDMIIIGFSLPNQNN